MRRTAFIPMLFVFLFALILSIVLPHYVSAQIRRADTPVVSVASISYNQLFVSWTTQLYDCIPANYSLYSGTVLYSGLATSYYVTGLTSNTVYTFNVNLTCTNSAANPLSPGVGSGRTALRPAGTPIVSVTNPTSTSLNVSWTHSLYDCTLNNYTLYYSTQYGGTNTFAYSGFQSYYNVQGLVPATSYYFTVYTYCINSSANPPVGERYGVTSDGNYCDGSFDEDADVDGSDLALLIANASLLDIAIFAENFGKDSCQ